MQISQIDPAALTLDLADELAALTAEAQDGVPVPQPTGPSLMLACQVGGVDGPDDAVFVATVDGALAGYAVMTLPRLEYTDLAFVRGAVAPAYQRQGVGRALAQAVAEASGRPRLRARTFAGTSGPAALERLGFAHQMTTVVRELPLDEVAPVARPEAPDYELVRQVGPTPEADLAAMVVLREAINDAPDALEYEAYPPERIRRGEAAWAARRQTPYVVWARHRATGDPAGLTMLVVDEFSPEVAHQEDTSVVRAHRGHGLGLALKLDMLDWLREERPEVRAVQTWNDQTNHHMIAVNERLGMRVIAQSQVWKRG